MFHLHDGLPVERGWVVEDIERRIRRGAMEDDVEPRSISCASSPSASSSETAARGGGSVASNRIKNETLTAVGSSDLFGVRVRPSGP